MKKRKLKKALKRIRWECDDYIKNVGRKQRACKEVVLEAIQFGAANLKYADIKFRKDKQFIREIVEEHNGYEVGTGLVGPLKKDREFIFELMELAHPFSSVVLRGMDASITGDRDFVEQAYREGYQILEAASDSIRNDEEFILSLADKYDTSVYWSDLGKDLRARALEDRELLKRLISASGSILCGINNNKEHKKLLADKELILLAIQKDYYTFYLADTSLYDDEEVILTMLLKYLETGTSSDFIQCASERLKNDPTIILASENIDYCKMLLDTFRKDGANASVCDRQGSDSMCDGS